MTASVLISDHYRELQQELHRNPDYGVASVHYAPLVAKVREATGIAELLDYGAGKGRLGDTLRQTYRAADRPPLRSRDREWSAIFTSLTQ